MSKSYPIPKGFSAPVDGRPDLLIIAGEHSGDEHAAQLIADVRSSIPDLKVACLGGSQLKTEGVQLLYDLTAVSIVGFVEVAKHYRFFKRLFELILEWIETHQPKHICLVDYPGFNLRLAKEIFKRGLSVKGGGSIGVSYYIGPQVWAWKAKRRFAMARDLDCLGVIFPFEVECFSDTDLPTQFVGHPFVHSNYELPFRYDSSAPVLLLPGSRVAAVSRIFPVLLNGFRLALKSKPNLKANIIYPSQKVKDVLDTILEENSDLKDSIRLNTNTDGTMPASAVLMSSGTISLACALSGIPGAIVYRLNPISYFIGRFLVDVPYIGISNLLLGRSLHPEFIQGAAKPKELAKQILDSLENPRSIQAAAEGAAELREQLLRSSKSTNAANWLIKQMGYDSALKKV